MVRKARCTAQFNRIHAVHASSGSISVSLWAPIDSLRRDSEHTHTLTSIGTQWNWKRLKAPLQSIRNDKTNHLMDIRKLTRQLTHWKCSDRMKWWIRIEINERLPMEPIFIKQKTTFQSADNQLSKTQRTCCTKRATHWFYSHRFWYFIDYLNRHLKASESIDAS